VARGFGGASEKRVALPPPIVIARAAALGVPAPTRKRIIPTLPTAGSLPFVRSRAASGALPMPRHRIADRSALASRSVRSAACIRWHESCDEALVKDERQTMRDAMRQLLAGRLGHGR